jgi:hypothetical protein
MGRRLRGLVAVALLAGGLSALAPAGPAAGQTDEPLLLQTTLTGLREVAPDGSLGAGDPDGVGAATLQVTPTSLCARINVSGIDLPAAAAHVHGAPVGVNGPIVVPLPVPGEDGLVDGCAEAPDPAVLAGILDHPAGFYVNVHTAAFPAGAVRGQLTPAPEEGTLLATRLAGSEEVGADGRPGVGDPEGAGIATVAVSPEARRVCFELSVTGVALPAAAAHIHGAPIGVNGPVVVPLTAPDADGRSRGCARSLDAAVVEDILEAPLRFYVNVHTGEFPDGAVRGQLAPATGFAGNDLWDDAARWVCGPNLPASADPCRNELDSTVVGADGTLTPDPLVVAEDPAFDCFYVYPTVNLGDEGNAPFDGEYAAEVFTARAQAGRFSSVCHVFAPLHRQGTLGADRTGGFDYGAIAYGDVVAAFRTFLEDHSAGRPFVLMGHSQGSGHLRRLIADVVDLNPALRGRLVSALLLGSTVAVPEGGDVGGSFEQVPACRTAGQSGCVISYASFRDRVPPPPNTFFGRTAEPDTEALCTDPADLAGTDTLDGYFDVVHDSPFAPGDPTQAWDPAAPDPPAITTPFVSYPGLVSSTCADNGVADYLELSVHPDPGPRTDDIRGDLTPEWGMHLVDASVALGTLIDVVAEQAAAWAAAS